MPRPKVLRRLWAQVAALGVDRIILPTQRNERHYFDTHLLEPDSFRPAARRGPAAGERHPHPAGVDHRRLKVLVEDDLASRSNSDLRLLADLSADMTRSHHQVGRAGAGAGRDRPRGRLEPIQRDLFAAHGLTLTGLGPRTLRTDTACVALLAVFNGARTQGPWDEDPDPVGNRRQKVGTFECLKLLRSPVRAI